MLKRVTQIVFLISLLGNFLSVSAQNNHSKSISGIISDAENDDPIPGVTIVIEGTNTGTISKNDGSYTITVSDSKAVIIFSFVGYTSQKIAVGNNQTINVRLKTDVSEIDEVVITAQATGQKNAIRQQINSNTIKNVVAADRLQENPDANAVEAIGRLPGISVARSGGEGNGLIIRGLESKYTAVTLNGVIMPSTGGNSRETNISGISQYILQGVEVYKSLTADMEANSVAGTVNMKLRETPKGFKSSAMAQMGYNNLNNYYGNYKLEAEISNRFLNDKFGVFFTASAERVNRSTQTMSADYGLASTAVDILLNNVHLNDIMNTVYRRSAMLSLDYKVAPSTKLNLYGLYSYSKNDNQSESKNYGVSGAGSVGYGFNSNPNHNSNIVQTALSGETKLNFLKMELDYGVAYSQSITNDPQSRNWNFDYSPTPTDATFSLDVRKKNPEDVIPLFNDKNAPDNTLRLTGFGQSSNKLSDKNLTSYLNVKIPYHLGSIINGYLKFGGTYRHKTRDQKRISGGQNILANQFGEKLLADSLSWIETNMAGNITGVNMRDYQVSDFLDGKYDFGWHYNFNNLNQLTDMWSNTSQYYFNQGAKVWMPIFGEVSKIGYGQNISDMTMNGQDITENYGAGYLMTEINIGKWVMILPGVRYEETRDAMRGFSSTQPTLPDPIYAPIPGDSTSATRTDHFLLPMIHLRIKPGDSYYFHFAYTQTLSRPDFNLISPNTYTNTGFQPFAYTAENPALKSEHWTNYDAQFTLHNKKIGLFSVSGFYKSVKDKIWSRSYQRIKGDPVVPPFPDASLVNMNIVENHQYPIYLKGAEVELQTSFWYLPKPFNYFTLYANYTYTDSKTQYPSTKIINVIPDGGGRPVPMRIDSTTTGVMLFQPKDILNFSLGFERKGLNVWLSYQYNGRIFTGKNYTIDAFDPLKEYYNRWDLQISQKLAKKLKGLEILANIANLSNFTETTRFRGDPRPTYLEKYGWTADLGVRYRF